MRRERWALVFATLLCGGCSREDAKTSSGASRADAAAPATAMPQPAESTDSIPPASDGRVETYDAASLDRILGSLTARTTASVGHSHPAFHFVEGRRVASGTPEIHDEWIDVAIAQAGRATVLTGGTVRGSTLAGAGEHRGGTLTGGTPRSFATGDLMVIPAGTPHQYLVARGDSLRYLTIKVKR